MHKVHKILIVKISKITHPTILQILIKMDLFILCFALIIKKKIVIKARINNLASVKNKICSYSLWSKCFEWRHFDVILFSVLPFVFLLMQNSNSECRPYIFHFCVYRALRKIKIVISHMLKEKRKEKYFLYFSVKVFLKTFPGFYNHCCDQTPLT